VPTAALWVNGRLQLNFLSETPEKADRLTLEKDIVLDSATSRALGYEQVTLRAGEYPVDYSSNPHGAVSPDVTTRGLVITVEIGRPSQDCRGFGICGITIGPLASARSVPTAALWVNGRLQLNFLSETPEKADLLTIEKDIVLDSATSRALGYEQVTLRAGEYPVDYSSNPHGQVSPEVTPRQFTILHSPSGNFTITWPANGWTFQEADDVAGPWTNSRTQTSPATLPTDGVKKFYRLTPR
jgi:hypothetical protein